MDCQKLVNRTTKPQNIAVHLRGKKFSNSEVLFSRRRSILTQTTNYVKRWKIVLIGMSHPFAAMENKNKWLK